MAFAEPFDRIAVAMAPALSRTGKIVPQNPGRKSLVRLDGIAAGSGLFRSREICAKTGIRFFASRSHLGYGGSTPNGLTRTVGSGALAMGASNGTDVNYDNPINASAPSRRILA